MLEIDSAFPRMALAARALLNWTPADLAREAGVPIGDVKAYEAGVSNPVNTTAALRAAFEREGIAFVLDTRAGETVIGVTLTRRQ